MPYSKYILFDKFNFVAQGKRSTTSAYRFSHLKQEWLQLKLLHFSAPYSWLHIELKWGYIFIIYSWIYIVIFLRPYPIPMRSTFMEFWSLDTKVNSFKKIQGVFSYAWSFLASVGIKTSMGEISLIWNGFWDTAPERKWLKILNTKNRIWMSIKIRKIYQNSNHEDTKLIKQSFLQG